MLRRILNTAKKSHFTIGLGVSGIITGLIYRDQLKSLANDVLHLPKISNLEFGSEHQGDFFFAPPYTTPVSPERKWEENWDGRDPMLLINMADYNAASDERKREMIARVTSTATRNIFLIRHGQYELDSDKKQLTQLGREQAALLGKRLAESNSKVRYDKCIMSTMTRARETAHIMLEQMPELNASKEHKREDSILEEGAPYPPEPPIIHWKPQHYFFRDGARIEAAFRKYFHRAASKQKEDSNEVIVCHANVIRYFVCRALQFPPEGWLRISLANSSITWIQIRPNGHVVLRTLGDFGHLPSDKVSFT